MANLKHLLLDKIGLSTRDRLAWEAAVKERWHSLVRDVFARYYLKCREPFYSYLPPLPHRYSADWESQMRDDLQEFLEVDLQPVAELLEVCGFGTERWEQLTGAGLGHLEDLLDRHLGGNGSPRSTSADLETALEEARCVSRSKTSKNCAMSSGSTSVGSTNAPSPSKSWAIPSDTGSIVDEEG